MTYPFLKLFIITIFIISSSCNHESKNTSQSNFEKITDTIAEIDSPNLLTQPDSNQFFQKQKLEKKEPTDDCFFQKKTFDLPNISETLGDTLKIQSVYDWLVSFEPDYDESEIRKIVGRGGKYFQLSGNDLFEIIGWLEDEGEYLSVHIYSIDKENCEILGKEIIAETTAWENGYKESFSILEADFTIKKIKRVGFKDWGDYTKWKRDSSTTLISFETNGKILLEKL